MHRILYTYIFLAASAAHVRYSRRYPGLRVLYGVPDTKNKYSFVVALVSDDQRICTGTLLSPEWVLTAAHCIDRDSLITHVQHGNMTMYPSSSSLRSIILERIPHPGYREGPLCNDIALVRVSFISLPVYGRVNAVDYGSMIGLPVKYAGFGTTQFNSSDDDRRPLLIGEGVIRSCLDLQADDYSTGFFLCVAPKCSNDKADSAPGDSGGPLFLDEEIVGIVCCGTTPIGFYTAISPYILWIREIIMGDKNKR